MTLRDLYNETVKEPVPDDFKELLAKLSGWTPSRASERLDGRHSLTPDSMRDGVDRHS